MWRVPGNRAQEPESRNENSGVPLWGPSDPLLPTHLDDRHCCVLGPMEPMRQSPSPCSSRPSSPRTLPYETLGYVGIDAVLDQLKIKAMKMGFEFNIMVVGE